MADAPEAVCRAELNAAMPPLRSGIVILLNVIPAFAGTTPEQARFR
jgi:hypothetical protein